MEDIKSNNRVLLGYGDIAKRLSKISVAQGIPVTAVRRTAVENDDIHFIAGDVTQADTILQSIDGSASDIVITLTPDNYSEQGYRDSYLACAKALATVLSSNRIENCRVIFVSSTSVYGQNNGDWVDETSECLPNSETAKVLVETEAAIEQAGIPYCNLRFSGIYGPGRTRIIERTRSGKIPAAEPVHWTNRIHADDCARVIDYLLGLDPAQLPPYVLATDSAPAPRYEVQMHIARELGVSVSSEASLGKGNEPSGKRCSNRLLRELGFEFLYPDYRSGFSLLIKAEH